MVDKSLYLSVQLHFEHDFNEERMKLLTTLSRIQSSCPSAVFGVIVNEHIVGHGQQRTLYTYLCRYGNLKCLNRTIEIN